MSIKYTAEFLRHLKKQKVIIRKSFKNAIEEFIEDPNNPQLNNHQLKRQWTGFRSINITADYRAVYKVVDFSDGDSIYYFVALGTHKQ